MNSSIIHPDLQQIAKSAPSMKLSRGNLWLWRFLTNLRRRSKFPEGVVVENRFIPSEDKQRKIRLRTYRPKSTVGLLPGLVWFHGGGLVIGKPEIDDELCLRFVQEAGIVVISVQYRYAPEHPFPAGLEDAYTALKWTHIQGRQIDVDPNRIGVGGESAGGCIAAALAQMAYDRSEIPLKTQHLIYPMLDDRSSIHPDLPDDSLIWNKQSNRFGWEAYLGKPCGSFDLPAYAVPARRADLSGLPPTWIGVGTLDLFHTEDIAYAQRLQQSGVACDLHIVDGAFHGFDVLAPQAHVSQDFLRAQINALKTNLFAGKRIFTAVDMIPGQTYRVVRAFRDFDKSLHDIGESWVFVKKNFLPYDDGLTISVEQGGKPRMFRMQWREAEQGEVIDKFSDYVEEE